MYSLVGYLRRQLQNAYKILLLLLCKMTTIVSALLTNINGYRSIEKYIEFGKKLLTLPINKVIFIERDIYEEHFSNVSNENTTIVFIQKRDLYLYAYADQITDFSPMGDPQKDTLEYMFVQCNKTEWIRRAIEMNPYNSNNFAWIDFGVWHLIRDDQVFTDSCMNISQKQVDGVRIACGDPNYINNPECCKSILWFFLGSIFGEMHKHLFKQDICDDALGRIPDATYSPAEIINIFMNETNDPAKFCERLIKGKNV